MSIAVTACYLFVENNTEDDRSSRMLMISSDWSSRSRSVPMLSIKCNRELEIILICCLNSDLDDKESNNYTLYGNFSEDFLPRVYDVKLFKQLW